MTENTKGLFFGGVPTEPEVRMLREAYPEADMEPGTVIPYDEVAELIGTPKTASRFRTVTNRWRSMVERETGRVVIGTEPGVGFKVLDNGQKVDLGYSKLSSAVRHARRAHIVSARLDAGASDEERARALAVQRKSAALIATAQVKSTAALPTLEG